MCVGRVPLYCQGNGQQRKVIMNEKSGKQNLQNYITLNGKFVSRIRRSICPAPALEIAT